MRRISVRVQPARHFLSKRPEMNDNADKPDGGKPNPFCTGSKPADSNNKKNTVAANQSIKAFHKVGKAGVDAESARKKEAASSHPNQAVANDDTVTTPTPSSPALSKASKARSTGHKKSDSGDSMRVNVASERGSEHATEGHTESENQRAHQQQQQQQDADMSCIGEHLDLPDTSKDKKNKK